MKIIFLDFDGVLNTRKSRSKVDYHKDPCETAHIEVLNKIIKISKAKVVITSSWRIYWSRNKIRRYLTKKGLKGTIIGVTPEDRYYCIGALRGRGICIQRWLDENTQKYERKYGKLTNFAILDDGLDMAPFLSKLIRTDNETGLTKKHGPEVLRVLGNSPLAFRT